MDELRDKVSLPDIRSGENFSNFYNNYYPRFVHYAFYYVKDKATAEDIASNAILEYWVKKDSFKTDTDALCWLLTVVKNKCLNYLKHLKVVNEFGKKSNRQYEWEITSRIQILEDATYSKIFSGEIVEIIENTLEKLPETTRNIFRMNRIQNRSRKEIAQILNVSVQAVDYHVQKTLKMLMTQLKEYFPVLLLLLP
jgi:RNA polymerase sigma-70 factor (ECF subfamily)